MIYDNLHSITLLFYLHLPGKLRFVNGAPQNTIYRTCKKKPNQCSQTKEYQVFIGNKAYGKLLTLCI